MDHLRTTEPGVWEPAWSEANGVKYTLELEKRNRECDGYFRKGFEVRGGCDHAQ